MSNEIEMEETLPELVPAADAASASAPAAGKSASIAPSPSRSRSASPPPASASPSVDKLVLSLAEESGETLRRWKPDQFASAVEGFTRASIAPTVRACRTAGWLEREVILSWRSLRWRKDGLALLNVVSGSLHPGEMVAVMGSRATSLLEVLADRATGGRLTGQVLLDGFEPDSSYKRMVGYVPTEDFHLPMLTVRETINFSSRLRARPEVPQRVAEFRTEVIMKMLGLDGVADSPVGNELIRGISGGEKRRLSIAVELAAGHSVLLASKPTNGLDSATAMDLVRKTREMCRGGNAAIYSITQAAPELLNEFDRIMCLSRGTLVYYGPPQEAEAHLLRLGFVRPAEKSVPDFINEVLDTPEVFFDPELAPDVDPRRSLRDHHSLRDHGNGDAVKLDVLPTTYHETWQRLVCGFQESEARAELGRTLWNEMLPHVEVDDEEEPPEPRKYNASLKEQMKEVFRREYLAFVRNEELMGAFFMGAIVLAFTFGITFFDLGDSEADVRGRAGVLFFGIASSPFDTMVFIPALMVDARAVFYQQRKAGYFRAVGYYLTRMLQGLPATALRQLLVTVILYSMVNLRGGPFSEQFFYFYAVTFMVFIISRALTFALVYASPNQTVAQAIVPTVYLIFMLTAGFLLQEDAAPAGWKWFYTINFERSALAGVFINEFVGETGYTCDGPTGSCLFNSGRDVLDFYSFGTDDEDDKYPLLAWLVLFFAIANLIAIASTYLFDYSDAVSIYERASAGPGDMSVLHSSNPGAVKIDTAAVVEFRDLCYDVPVPNPDEEARKATPIVQRRLLKNINGFAKPGRMLCLMGASGAGKSTLLDVLAGKKTGGTLDGDILVNGHAKDEFFGRYSGYVEQNDSIDEFSTVREAIDFSANIRLGPETSDEERRTIVHSVMEELGLTPWANHRIGVPGSAGVPGDIRKKVTTGVELVLRPGILFLDEPTTGLTSADATSVMESVRNLANRITVICTIHQPSQEIVGKFDDILLLQPGGEVVYTGPLDELAAYFRRQGLGEYVEGSNIADFALEALKARSVAIKAAQADGVADDELPPDPAQLWRDSPECAAVNDQLEQGVAAPDAKKPEFDSLFANGFVRQFQLLLQREITIRKRDTYGIGARLGSALFAAILLATLYWRLPVEDFAFTADNNRMSMAAFTVATSCYFAQAVIGGMVGFRPIYFRETTNGMYSTEAFYLARFIADLPVQLAMAFGSSIIVFWATNVSPEDQGENFVLWIVGTVVVQMLGTAVNEFTAAAMPNGELAVNGAVMIFSFSFIFSGFFLVRDSIPVYLIWLYWFNVFTHPIAYFCALAVGDTPNGQTLLDLFSIDPKDKGFYIGLTIVHLLFYRFLAYIALKKINHIKR